MHCAMDLGSESDSATQRATLSQSSGRGWRNNRAVGRLAHTFLASRWKRVFLH